MTKGKKKDESIGVEEKYKALVETAADAVITLDLLGRLTFVNPAGERISGYSREELVGKHFRELLPAKYIPVCLNVFQKALRGQPTPPIEIEMITKQGERVLLELLGRPVKRGRRVIEIIGVGREITERKQAEEALRESEERFRTIVETAPSVLLITDAKGNNIYVSPNCEEITGYTQEELQGRVRFWVHEDDMPRVKEVYDRTFREGVGCKDLEYKAVKKNGEVWYASISWEPILDAKGKLQGVVFQTIDITERKRTEEALRESEEKYRNLIERANDGIVIIQDAIIRYANPRLAEMWGGNAQEFIGTPFTDYVDPDELPKLADRYKRRMAGEDITPIYETVLRRKDGSKLYAELNAGLITYEGKPADLVIIRDIAERKRVEREIRRHHDELAALNAIAMTVTSTLDLREVLRTIQERVVTLLGEKYPLVFGLFDEENQTFEVMLTLVQEGPLRRAEKLMGMKFRELTFPLSTLKPALREALLAGKPYVTSDGSDIVGSQVSRRLVQAAQKAMGVNTIVDLPLWMKGKFVGAMVLLSQKEKIPDEEIELLSSIASQAAIAIANARLYEEERERRQEAETLRQAAQALSATLDLQEVFQSILSELQKVVPYDSASVQLLKGDRLEIIGGHGFPNLDELLGISFPLDSDNPNRQVIATRAPFIVEDAPAVYSNFRQEPHAQAGIRAWLGVPLLFGDRLIGMITLDKKVPGFYTEEHAHLALAFAAQAAIAIENARLYEELRRELTERKQTEEALRKSEERYKKQFEEAMDAIFIADAETGILVDCNRVASELVGREKSELVGKHQRILHPPEEIEGELSRTFRQHLKEKEGQVLETQVITKKGEIKDVAIKANILELEGQKVLVGIFRDITERKQAEEALRRSEERFRLLVEHSTDAFFLHGFDGRILDVNRHACESLGYTREELLRLSIQDIEQEFVSGEHLAKWKQMVPGKPITLEGAQKRKDGTTFPVEVRLGVFESDERQLMLGLVRDITERKRAEEEAHKRLKEITALHKVSEVINATLDLKEIFQRVVEELSNTFGYRLVDIYLLEEDGLRLQASLGYDEKTTIEFIPLEHGVVGRVARTGEAAWVPDVSQDPDYISAYPEIKSEICVPIKSGETLRGVLNVECDECRFLTEDDLLLLHTLSSHIGVAIENARLYEEEQRRSAQRRTIAEVGRKAASILEMGALLPQVADLIAQNFGYDHVHIFQIDADSQYAVFKAGTGKAGLAIAKEGLRLKVGEEGMIGWVAQHSQPLLANDVSLDPYYLSHPALPNTRSELAVPIHVGGRIIGVLDVQSTKLNAFDEGDRETLQTLADQLAVAMENARLYEEERRRAEELHLLFEATRDASTTLDLHEVLKRVAAHLCSAAKATSGDILILDESGERATVRAQYWGPEASPLERTPDIGTVYDLTCYPTILRAMQENRPLVTHADDPDLEPATRDMMAKFDGRSALRIPMYATGVLRGYALIWDSRRRHEWSGEEVRLCQTLANQAAVAIENARLYQETKRLAITDSLTGLYNLRYFYEALNKEIQRSERYHRSVSLVIIDIDGLKAYNDLYGHLAGDDLLIELAQLMSKVTRRTDTLARYGGDEFAIILPETETESAAFLAKRLQQEVREHRFSMQGGQTIGRITLSLGVATYPDHADSAKALVDAADKALLRAKQAGKNRLSIRGEELTELEPQ